MKNIINKILLYFYRKNNSNLKGSTSCITGYIGGWDLRNKDDN